MSRDGIELGQPIPLDRQREPPEATVVATRPPTITKEPVEDHSPVETAQPIRRQQELEPAPPASEEVVAKAGDVPSTSNTAEANEPATSTIDPNVPSDASAPTALPTNPATSPAQQAKAAKEEHPEVVKREVQKTKAAERELKGEKPQGTVVAGIEDDRLWTMIRRFDAVSISYQLKPITCAH